jgi:predicted deacylase
VLGVLRHLGVLEGDSGPAQPGPIRFLSADDERDRVMASLSGVFEPYCGLGDKVREGDPAGVVHSMEEPERAPVELHFHRSGIILARRVPARVKPGDYVFQVAREITRDELLPQTVAGQAKP